MELSQLSAQKQNLCLCLSMKQAIHCLELPIQELHRYLEEEASSNPLLEIDLPPLPLQDNTSVPDLRIREPEIWNEKRGNDNSMEWIVETAYTRPQTYREYLYEQLGQMKELDQEMLNLCTFLVDCLNSAGYLDCELSDLAAETGCTEFILEQALYIVQSLDPLGTGARSLQECLTLQLAQSSYFNDRHMKVIRLGLEFLAQKDLKSLAQVLGTSISEAEAAGKVIQGLNPIPSRGFASDDTEGCLFPEAVILVENKQIIVQIDSYSAPRLNGQYVDMIGKQGYDEVQTYLKENVKKAKELINAVEKRNRTIERIIVQITREQFDFFLHGAPLLPMTMLEMAEHMNLSISTISRAVKEKYVEFNGVLLPLRSFFSLPVNTNSSGSVSALITHSRIADLIRGEDPQKPFSDEALRTALLIYGINISRRTVAKYRMDLGIPTANKRRGSSI